MTTKQLSPMTKEQFVSEIWRKGDIVTLTNGKEYEVVFFNKKKEHLILYTKEYDAKFKADNRITHSHKKQRKNNEANKDNSHRNE